MIHSRTRADPIQSVDENSRGFIAISSGTLLISSIRADLGL